MEKAANQVLKQLSEHQFKAYLVGGYVRDSLLKKPTQDIDIATSASPQQVMQLFPRTVPTGLKHGTVTVIHEGIQFEVTTFRKESTYDNHRHPQDVTFVSDLHEDLQRRDFTMNAMAMDQDGIITDPFNGQEDMQLGVIRCVGNPHERFQEDALRMLRCIRFAANYGYRIESETWNGLLRYKALLRHIAMERIRVELEKMIAGPNPFRALELLLESGILQHTKTELHLPMTEWLMADLPSYLIRLVELNDANLRWAMLFRSMKMNSDKSSRAMRKLTFSSRQSKAILPLIKLDFWLREQIEQAVPDEFELVKKKISDQLSLDRLKFIWKRAAVQFGKNTMQGWLQIMRLEMQVKQENVAQETDHCRECAFNCFINYGEEWITEMPVEILSDLDITGNDLMARFELSPGPWVSEMLHRLLLDAAFGNARNQKIHLLQRAEVYRKGLKK